MIIFASPSPLLLKFSEASHGTHKSMIQPSYAIPLFRVKSAAPRSPVSSCSLLHVLGHKRISSHMVARLPPPLCVVRVRRSWVLIGALQTSQDFQVRVCTPHPYPTHGIPTRVYSFLEYCKTVVQTRMKIQVRTKTSYYQIRTKIRTWVRNFKIPR